MGASNLPDSCKDVKDAKRRESEWKKSEKGESPVGRKNERTNGNAPHQEEGQSRRRHATAHGNGPE